MTHRVDVIIPTRNRADLTVEAVRSVLAQTHDSLRVIVVDDASDDGSPDAYARFATTDARVEVIERSRSGGAQQARQTGLEISEAPFIGILDSDDLWEPTKLQMQLDRYVQDRPSLPQLGAILCGHVWCDVDGVPMGDGSIPAAHGWVSPLVSDNMSAVLLHRDAILRAGGFLPAGERSRPGANHIDLFVRLSQHCQMSAVDKVLVKCRVHGATRDSDVLRGRDGADNLAYLLDRHAEYLAKWPRERARLRARTAARYLAVGAKREGRSFLAASLRGAGPTSAIGILLRYGPFAAKALLLKRSRPSA